MSTVPRPAPPATTGWTARAERRDSRLEIDFSGPTTAPFTGRVRNVSTSGMLIDTPHRMSVGDVLTARMPGKGDTLCLIVRVTSKGAGVRFMNAIDEDEAAGWW